jgi:hypothetical protein
MHGALRMCAKLNGETIEKSYCEFGYTHRAKEKLGENRTFHNFIVYTDRLNYCSALTNNVVYAMSVERLMGVEVPERATWIRITAPKGRLVCCHLSAARQPFRGCESGSCLNGWKPEFMQHDDRAMLSMALGHHEQIHSVGIVVYPMQRAEYVNRAEGRA